MKYYESGLQGLQRKIHQPGSPQIEAIEKEDNKIVISLYIPENLNWFEGHFPGHAVLPGVVQLHWVTLFSQELLGEQLSFKGISNLKYKNMVLPNIHLQLVMEYQQEKQKVKFIYRGEEGLYSSGIIQF